MLKYRSRIVETKKPYNIYIRKASKNLKYKKRKVMMS